MPAGIRVDDVVFGSATGVDPVSGVADGDLEAQLKAAIETLGQLLSRGGMGWSDVERVDAYAAGSATETLSALLNETLAPMTRIPRFFTQPAVLGGGQRLRLDVIANQGGAADLRYVRARADTPPAAVRIGPLLFAFDVTPADAATGRAESPETGDQVSAAFQNLDRVLDTAGMRREQLLRISGYFRDLGEKDALNRKMVGTFPDASQKPVHKYVQAALPHGVAFSLQALALMSLDRRIVEMEGVRHNDPISLGAVAGNVFVSSRVQGRLEAGPREQAARLIEHTRRLVEHVSGRFEGVTQTTWGIGDPAFGSVVAEECAKAWPGESAPQLQIVEADFPHSPLPRVEFTALI
jgi:enamine deaminase RidA (YjgF/YER057c/UK114 family)